ncbi:hypothetical protein BC833DRAFT_590681 [Globomyces pollinis-pini]|nr:hypothetical protein BC833DRAFT_590681 [Globomyces pollinis-pini]
MDIIDPKNPEAVTALGGVESLAKHLKSDIVAGLPYTEALKNEIINQYGSNILPDQKQKSFMEFVWEALHDKTLIVLMVAAATEVGIGIYKVIKENDGLALIDGGAILIAVIIVVMIGAVSDFKKQGQFKALSDFGKSLNTLKVNRNNEIVKVLSTELLVGDVVHITTGVVLPADGYLIEGFNISCDESSMTGEPMAIEKSHSKDPFLLSGTNVVNGVGTMLVINTGTNSMSGKTLLALDVEEEDTPLQEKLGRLADDIAKAAFYLAITMVIVLTACYFLVKQPLPSSVQISTDLLGVFILAVTVVVVAVPEGLPLAVTLSLAHATMQMLKDNNLVRHLAACETMGNATTICSDKTGTLTLNKMTVVDGILMERNMKEMEEADSSLEKLIKFICLSFNVNSTAGEVKGEDGTVVLEGSKTEIAILNYTQTLKSSYAEDRVNTKVVNVEPFSSARKRMSCIVELPIDKELDATLGLETANGHDSRQFVFVKGASEIVLKCCSQYLSKSGKILPMTDDVRTYYTGVIDKFAGRALRTISGAFKATPLGQNDVDENGKINDEADLILIGIVGIEDPLRDEVPLAVARCQKAGVVVRMVTGDSAPTARSIATGCGILSADGIVMEGPDFRKLSEAELDRILPKLQVLARSSPLDKQILVNNLKRLGETVAVTGDGTNDAPALAAADVGFSMGIAGTEVAKQASDIILMDDNFASLVKAVVWGRCVYDAIRKFLQFQLTVNVSAVVITVVTAVHTTVTGDKRAESALTTIQLLWVNLIMDTLAALALATDLPTDALLDRKPSKRTDDLVNIEMKRQIIGQAIYQIVVCLAVYFWGPSYFGNARTLGDGKEPYIGYVTATLIFNIFIFCQVFNEINSRSIQAKYKNVFSGFFTNKIFISILFVTIVGQAFIVQFGGLVFTLDPKGLSLSNWLISIVIGSGSLVVGFLIRVILGSAPEVEDTPVKPVHTIKGDSKADLHEKN